ncbi:conserved hypothetical protein [Gammaproteobacteria bacterium]
MFFDLGFLTVPILSFFAVFGFSVLTDTNKLTFDVTSVPKVVMDMGYTEKTVRDVILHKIYDIADVAGTSRGVGYSTISDMDQQSLWNLSENLGIKNNVLAVQALLGMIPYQLKGELMQEGDVLYLNVVGFSSHNHLLGFVVKTDRKVSESSQTIREQAGLPGSHAEDNNHLVITNTHTEIKGLLEKAAETIVDRIDPYLLARYYFVLESPQAKFTKTLPQLARCLEVLPEEQKIWPLLLWGRTYRIRGEYAKAIEVFRELERIDPHFPFTYLRWGETLAVQGRYREAIEMYQRVLNNTHPYPAYPVARSIAYGLWARSLVALEKLDEAEAALRTGLGVVIFGHERSAAKAVSHNALGCFLMNYRHNDAEAEYHLRKAIYLDNNAKYYAALQDVIAKRVPGYDTYLEETRAVGKTPETQQTHVLSRHNCE